MKKLLILSLLLVLPLLGHATTTTKAELVAELQTKYYKVGTPVLQQTRLGMGWYVVEVYELSADSKAIYESTVAFYVEAEGTAEEKAFWSRSEPKPAPSPPTFQEELQAAINAKVAAGTIKYGRIVDSNADVKKALVDVVTPTDTEKRALVEQDEQGVFSFTILP